MGEVKSPENIADVIYYMRPFLVYTRLATDLLDTM